MTWLQTAARWIAAGIFSRAALFLVAGATVASLFVPWHLAPARSYPAFDPNLVFVNHGASHTQADTGSAQLGGDNATLVARDGGSQTIHMVDSESDFTAEFDVTPRSTDRVWQPVSTVVQPPAGSRRFFVLIAAAGGTILFHRVAIEPVDLAGQPAVAGSFTDNFANPNLPGWRAASGVEWVNTGPTTGSALRITSIGTNEVGTFTIATFPVATGSAYKVSAEILTTAGAPHFKLAVGWQDDHKMPLGYVPDWDEWPKPKLGALYAPVQVSLWHPRKDNAIILQFSSGLHPMISILTRDAKGRVTTTDLATYVFGNTYHVNIQWRHGLSAHFEITGSDGHALRYVANRSMEQDIFHDPFVNLSLQVSAPNAAETTVALRNASLIIPARTRFALNVEDQRLVLLTLAVLVWFISYLVYHLRPSSFRHYIAPRSFRNMGRTLRRLLQPLFIARALLVALIVGGLVSLYGASAILFDGHPFDRLTQESAAYVIGQYGIDALYGRTSAIPDAIIRGYTVAWSPAEFAYPPLMGYFYAAANALWTQFNSEVGPMADRNFYVFWRFGFALFILIDAALIVAIQRVIRPGSNRWGFLLAAAFALNPAVIFDGPIWGESNSLLSAGVLCAILALVTKRYRLMWAAIILAVLIKQTALLIVPLIIVFAVARRGFIRRSVLWRGILLGAPEAAFGLVVGFVSIAPFTLAGYHPATALLSTVQKLIDFGTPLTTYDSQVSGDTFPIWVLFTGAAGLHGHDRLWASDRTTLGTSQVTYAEAGLVLFVVVALVAAWAAWRSAMRSQPDYRRLMLAMGLVSVAYVSLNTRTSGHYLTLAIPFLLLAIPPRDKQPFIHVTAVTSISLLCAYGLVMFIAAKGEWPNFAGFGTPSTNAFSSFVYQVYTSDVAITLFAAWMFLVTVQLLIATAVPSRELRQKPNGPPTLNGGSLKPAFVWMGDSEAWQSRLPSRQSRPSQQS